MVMQFTITGKQMDVGDALKSHIERNVKSLVEKYFGGGIESHAVLHREAHQICCDLSVHVGRGILIQASEKDHDPYIAADKAAERVAKRLRRYKERLRSHHHNGHKGQDQVEAQYAIFAGIDAAEIEEDDVDCVDPDDGQPAIVAEMTTTVTTLTVSEAVMRMDLGEQPALMFRNSAHGGLNVVYRRKDGNIGWIDPGVGANA